MVSFLKKFHEYQRATTGTHEKLIVPKPNLEAVVLEPEVKTEVTTPANKLIPASAEVIHERACILASDMNLPLEWAEAIVKLDSVSKPKSIPLSSWLDIKEACNQLHRDNFGLLKLIINHGWSLQSIYGCHPSAPLTRFDGMGLVLLIHKGDEIVGVNFHRIKILKSSGNSVVLTPRLGPTGEGILLHELAP